MFQNIREQFLGWFYIFVFFFLLFFVFFGRDLYDYFFAPNEVEQYIEAYEKTFGKKMEVPDSLKQYIRNKQ